MDADQVRQIVADEIRRAIGYYYKEFMMWIFIVLFVGSCLWLSYRGGGDASFSYCPAEEPKQKLAPELRDQLKGIFDVVKTIQKAEKAEEKPEPEKDDKFLEDCGNFADAAVKEKVEKIQKKRSKTESESEA